MLVKHFSEVYLRSSLRVSKFWLAITFFNDRINKAKLFYPLLLIKNRVISEIHPTNRTFKKSSSSIILITSVINNSTTVAFKDLMQTPV